MAHKNSWFYTFQSTAKASGSIDSVTGTTGYPLDLPQRNLTAIGWTAPASAASSETLNIDISGSTFSVPAVDGGYIAFNPGIKFSSIACSFTASGIGGANWGAYLTGTWE